MTKKKPNETTIAIRPGWLIQNASSATGGIRRDRELLDEAAINRGKGLRTEYKTRTMVDNLELCAAIDGAKKKVDYALRKHCARTPVGWITDNAGLKSIREEVEAIREEAEALNEKARRAKCAHRAYIGIFPAKITVSTPEAVQEIARTVRTILGDTRDALRLGQIKELHKLKIRAINLDKLATGFQSDAIGFALERIPEATKELRGMLNDGLSAKKAGAKLDLEAIEAAIVHFETPQESAA